MSKEQIKTLKLLVAGDRRRRDKIAAFKDGLKGRKTRQQPNSKTGKTGNQKR